MTIVIYALTRCVTYLGSDITFTDARRKMASTKGFCEDLTEGKFSLPVIHSIRSSTTSNNELLNILKLHTSDQSLKSYALDYMLSQTKSLDYTKDVLIQLHQQAWTALAQIPGKNGVMEAILAKLMLD